MKLRSSHDAYFSEFTKRVGILAQKRENFQVKIKNLETKGLPNVKHHLSLDELHSKNQGG